MCHGPWLKALICEMVSFGKTGCMIPLRKLLREILSEVSLNRSLIAESDVFRLFELSLLLSLL